MKTLPWLLLFGVLGVLARPVIGAPTRTSSIAVDGSDVFVVNSDSNTVARLNFGGMAGVLVAEEDVSGYPRTVTVAGSYVFSADQIGDTVSRFDKATLDNRQQALLGVGCSPYGVVSTPDQSKILVSCQGTSELVILSLDLAVQGRVKLNYNNARAIAVASNGTTAYVTHYLTEEPATDAHVSVVDIGNKSITRVLNIGQDAGTCETQNSGQGVLNLLSAIVIMPDDAPAAVAGQIWIGGTQQNNVSKGLFKRETTFKSQAGAGMFPLVGFAPFPANGVVRNMYRPSFHDVTRLGIVKLNLSDGTQAGKIDIDEANNATDIELSADGTVAYVVDQTFNSYHIFNTLKGQGSDVTTLFGGPSAFGPGGKDPTEPCVQDALRAITGEQPYRMSPQAQITTIDGFNPVDTAYAVANTGVDFDAQHYWDTGVDRMRSVPDGIATAPLGIRLAPDGHTAYVHGYLSRNVVPVATAQPANAGKPDNFRCTNDVARVCGTSNDCQGGTGFCNHPGGGVCTTEADCGSNGPCVLGVDCVPLLIEQPVASIRGRCVVDDSVRCLSDADCSSGTCDHLAGDPLAPSLLDGKILFNTAARDASVDNGVGLGQAAPLFNNANTTGRTPGSVTSTSHDASYVSCTSCHADYGGQDGRTWDFSQFGASLRNTMDLRGRSGFNPGHCSHDANIVCTFDAACGTGNTCRSDDAMIPLNIPPADRARWFNPMLTVHWNGDRDEVEDFEGTFRQLQGSGDCDASEDTTGCQGALVQRATLTTTDPPRRTANCPGSCTPGTITADCPMSCFDIEPDLGPPNRNLPGQNTGKNVGYRLSHMADFVYSLTEFPKNPVQPSTESERGRALFADPMVNCQSCHSGGPGLKQFFTDKRPNPDFNPAAPGRADSNNPFRRHNVGTANLFDLTDPNEVASRNQVFQNSRIPIPGPRGDLGEYITPVLNDVWNTPPFLHDGSAHTLMDVVRACDSTTDDCGAMGRGRNVDRQHGVTDVLKPSDINALTAFQRTLTIDTRVGASTAVVNAGTMTIKSALVQFPKTGAKAGAASGRFKIVGTLSGRTIDLTQAATLEVAFPDQQRGVMTILERTLPLAKKGKGGAGTSRDDGVVALKLRPKGADWTFTLTGKKLDLSALQTGNTDLTVALSIGNTSFVRNRYLDVVKRRGKPTGVLRLPKRKKG